MQSQSVYSVISTHHMDYCAAYSQVVFSPTEMGTPQASSNNYKVFMKTEEAKKIKKSDVWTAPAAETSTKKES